MPASRTIARTATLAALAATATCVLPIGHAEAWGWYHNGYWGPSYYVVRPPVIYVAPRAVYAPAPAYVAPGYYGYRARVHHASVRRVVHHAVVTPPAQPAAPPVALHRAASPASCQGSNGVCPIN